MARGQRGEITRFRSAVRSEVRLKPDTTSEIRLKPDTTAEIRLKPDTTARLLEAVLAHADVELMAGQTEGLGGL